MDINAPVCIGESKITINLSAFLHKDYVFANKELLLDIFGNFYKGQAVEFLAPDGDNTHISGFKDFIAYLVSNYGVDQRKIKITHLNTNVIFNNTAKYIQQIYKNDLTSAKFVGLIVGRFSPARFRMAYELDHGFTNDNYIIFRPSKDDINICYQHAADVYQKELAWFNHRTFDAGSATPNIRNWQNSSYEYTDIWNKFLIEVIAETDCHTNWWFTEKTARCLATGKPFVLLSGQYSLRTLKNKGYLTYSSVMDESYDLEPNPEYRIKKIIKTLTDIYTSIDRQHIIEELYKIADVNKRLYIQNVT